MLRPSAPPEPPPSPPQRPITEPDEGEPLVRFPQTEEAEQSLLERQVMSRQDFDALDDQAKQTAFTVARVGSLDALERIRGVLAEDVAQGGTLREFETRVEEVLGEGFLAPAHVETVYRTNVAQAYSDGQRQMLEHPLVADEFPYVAYHAVHDQRTRSDHLHLETLGIQGTNIYRADDPVIRRFWPPWDYQCRCAIIPMTLEDAARAGIHEAQEWLRAGMPPLTPAWAQPPPFEPPAGFGGRGAVRMSLVRLSGDTRPRYPDDWEPDPTPDHPEREWSASRGYHRYERPGAASASFPSMVSEAKRHLHGLGIAKVELGEATPFAITSLRRVLSSEHGTLIPVEVRAQDLGPAEQDTLAYYDAETNTVGINTGCSFWANEKRARQEVRGLKESGYWSSDSIDQPLWHEYGHMLAYARGGKPTVSGPFSDDLKQRITEAVSGRAALGPNELIGEVYAGVRAGNVYDKDIRDLFRHCGGAWQ